MKHELTGQAIAPTKPAASRLGNLRSLETRRRLIWLGFLAPAFVAYIVFMALPLFNSLVLSLYTGRGLMPDHFVGFQNYVDLFTNPIWSGRFLNALRNTVVFFLIHMGVQNTLGLLFAVLLATGFRGHNLYRTIIFLPATMSVVLTGFIWRLILNPQWGAMNKLLTDVGLESWTRVWLGDPNFVLPTLSLVSAWQWVGLPTMLFTAGLLTIPDDIIEAAFVDGASSWQTFWRIKFPLLMPVVGLVAILTFIGNFSAFDVVYSMAGTRGEPGYAADLLGTFFYRTAIAGEAPIARPDMGVGAAVASVTFLIMFSAVALWLVFSRRQSYNQGVF